MRATTQPLGTFLILMGVLASTLFANAAFAEATSIDRVVAVVNEDVIMESEYNQRLQATYRQIVSRGGSLPPEDVFREQVMERLIIENLQYQLAQRASVEVSQEELETAIMGIAQQNNMTLNQLQAELAKDGMDFESFKNNLEREMIIQRIQQGAVNRRIEITEQDITNFLNSEEGKLRSSTDYRLGHILISIPTNATEEDKQAIIDKTDEIVSLARSGTDFATLARAYSESQDAANGGDLGWRKKTQLPSLYAKVVDDLAEGEVSDPILSGNSYYILKMLDKKGNQEFWVQQTRARHVLVKSSAIRSEKEAGELLLGLREDIVNGKRDFAEVAKEYSEDFGSALKGGDIGWTNPGELVPEFHQVMDNSELNVVSMPFQTQFGWHIVEVLERRETDMSDTLLRNQVKGYLTQRRFEQELPLWLKELRDEAYVDIKI